MRYSLYFVIYILITFVPISASSKYLVTKFSNEVFNEQVIIVAENKELFSATTGTVEELRNACANYDLWLNNQHTGSLSPEDFFSMGKCHGIIETLGTTMYTLCQEKRRNLGMPKQLSADLRHVTTKTIIHALVVYSNKHPEAWEEEGYLFAINLISRMWPCK